MTNKNIIDKLGELERRIKLLENNYQDAKNSRNQVTGSKQQSFREFLNEKKPETANDRVLCIAYYYETIKKYDCFNAEDIKVGFREARIPAPKNPNDVINQNIAKAYMMDSEQTKDGKKAWLLTNTGIEVVDKGFSKKH